MKNKLTLAESLNLANEVENWRIMSYNWREKPITVQGEIEGIIISVNKDTPLFRKKLGPCYNIHVWDLAYYGGLRDNSTKNIYETALEKIASHPARIKPEKESQESRLYKVRKILQDKDR